MVAMGPRKALAQSPSAVAGDYAGAIGSLHLNLHLKVDAAGGITGALDSPGQGAMGIACTDVHLDGRTLAFSVPSVRGSWQGMVSADGKTLTGVWNQGKTVPLVFTRDTFVPAAKPSRLDGIWLGTLHAGGASLRLQLHIKSDAMGQEYGSLDSLDQGSMGIECGNVVFRSGNVSFDVPAVKGRFEGTLSADGDTLAGQWSQNGSSLPLTLTRQSGAIAAVPVAPTKYDPAMPPVSGDDLQAVLDRDLAGALKSGELAPSTGAGVSIGVVDHGVRRVFRYGVARPDSIFEIGSITKTFTGLILSQMMEQGKVKLGDPVRELLLPGTVAKPAGREITLLDLATHRSGLPRMPDNFTPVDGDNPYADYHAANLYAYLAKHGVERPEKTEFLYSNLGFGLLGQALAVRASMPYPALLAEEVLSPLGMHDTAIALTPAQEARFIPGHTADHRPAHAWDLDALAGAGAIRSTAPDMLIYLEANLHPEKVKPLEASPAAKTIAAALAQSHELHTDADGQKIALAWLFDPESGNYWHNGATGGYSAYAFFNLTGDYAAVVLLNTTIGEHGSFADRIGEHISERLAGRPAISLGD
jgi:CubicO group peptidase (beta-lactamase class C family)